MKRLILISLILSSVVWARNFDLSVEDSLARINPQFRQEWLSERGITEPFYNQDLFLPDSQNVRCVGRWPFGPSFNIIGKDSVIFLGSGSGVRIISVSTPNNPRQISQIALPGSADEMAIKDSLLYIDFSWTGIEIYNINTPSSPIHVNRFNNHIRDFFIKDSFCFAVSGDSFKIFNIKNPLNIIQLGGCADSGSSVVSVSGNYAYTGNRGSMHIIDMTNPFNPHIVNSWPGYIWAIANRNNLCYVMVGGSSSNAFKILDVSDPLNIQQLGTINNIAGYGICLKGFLAYLACSYATGGLAGLFIVDIGDSLNPAIVGSIDPSGWEEDVFVFNNFSYVYLAGNWEGLQVVNATDPTQPLLDTLCFSADLSQDITLDGNYAYVANDNDGLKIIDITNPALPLEVGTYDTVGTYPRLQGATAKDSFAYVTWPYYGRYFRTVDISDPQNPRTAAVCDGFGPAEDMVIKDSLVYVAEDYKFQIYNVTNPRQPRLVGICNLPNASGCVFLKDTLAYVGSLPSPIINIKDPANPTIIGSINEGPYGISVKDTFAYLAINYGGLQIWSVANPSSTYLIDTVYYTRGYDVVINDSFAYFGGLDFRVLNISNPVRPVEVGSYTTPDRVRRLFYYPPYIYAACFSAGMCIFEQLPPGIEENNRPINAKSIMLNIYPNPAGSYLAIRLPQTADRIKIFDVSGKMIREIAAPASQSRKDGIRETKISLKGISPGIYYLRLGKETKKFLVVK